MNSTFNDDSTNGGSNGDSINTNNSDAIHSNIAHGNNMDGIDSVSLHNMHSNTNNSRMGNNMTDISTNNANAASPRDDAHANNDTCINLYITSANNSNNSNTNNNVTSDSGNDNGNSDGSNTRSKVSVFGELPKAIDQDPRLNGPPKQSDIGVVDDPRFRTMWQAPRTNSEIRRHEKLQAAHQQQLREQNIWHMGNNFYKCIPNKHGMFVFVRLCCFVFTVI